MSEIILKEIEELERMEGINIAKLREMFDDTINLTKNNPDFSVYMLRKENFVIIYCTDKSYCSNHVIIFRDEEKAEAIVQIAKHLAEISGYLAFAANEFVEFIKQSLQSLLEVEVI